MAVSDHVHRLIQDGHFEQVAPALDLAELESPVPDVLSNDWPAALHLLAHVYNKTLPDARLLWRRLPQGLKQTPELEAAWKVVQYSWNRHYRGTWQALQGFQWSGALQPLIEALKTRLRAEALDLVSRAYAMVQPSQVAALCGLSEQDTLAVCHARGWTLDAASGMLVVTPAPQTDVDRDSLQQLHQLTDYMVHLEQ